MDKTIIETYNHEYELLGSMENFKSRFNYEIESSSLIINFHYLFYKSFEPELRDEEKKSIFDQIEKDCINNIKIEHIRATNLDNKEFFAWHLSMFILIQSFIQIINAKYNLENKEKITDIFKELLKDDFYKINKIKSDELGIGDINKKLSTINKIENIYCFQKPSEKTKFWLKEDSLNNKTKKPENYKILENIIIKELINPKTKKKRDKSKLNNYIW